MKKRQLLLLCLFFISYYSQSQTLIFQSGFESNSQMNNENPDDVDIIGIDGSLASPNDWVNDLEGDPDIGYFKIQYQGGTTSQRQAEIITDPTDASNKVLHYWINDPNISGAGRIQANIYENSNLTNVYFKTRLYLHDDFNIITDAGDLRNKWMTLMEFWNDAFWDQETHPFRISVSFQKLAKTPDPLHITITGQTRNTETEHWDNDVWEYTNTAFDVPIGQWMTVEINFIEGDACNGHFYMSITPDGEATTVVHDIQDYTHHPTDPSPDGLADFNPLKLYTSDDIVDFVRDGGGLLQVYWDDFELWKNKTVVVSQPCDPISRTPYLQAAATDRMVVKWSTRDATNSKLWYGLSPANLDNNITLSPNITDHEIEVTGLNPDTKYYYAVGDDNGQMVGADDDHYFRTSPVTGSGASIRTWVLGDSGMRNDDQRLARDGYLNYIGANPTDIILLLGNNAYVDGTDLEYQMALFENMYEDELVNTLLWTTSGEDENNTVNNNAGTGPYYDIFNHPTDGSSGGTASSTEAWYSFDYGNIHFVMLNSVDIDRSTNGAMLSWLETDLSNTSQEWIVASFHHAPYTGTDNNVSDTEISAKEMRENALPILEAGGVDLVLAAHSHNYQRSYLIKGHHGVSSSFNPNTMGLNMGNGQSDGDGSYYKAIGGPTDGDGAVYLVVGSSGQADDVTGEHPVMAHRAQKLGSLSLEVTDLQMDVRFIGETGEVEDYFTIMKQDEPPIVDITAPQDEAYYENPQTFTIETDAFDSNGSVTEVEFFVNDVLVGTDNTAPYSFEWTAPGDGRYVIKAMATDNEAKIGTDIINIGVGDLLVCKAIEKSSDDVEEKNTGSMQLTSGDLEMAEDNDASGTPLKIGLRFTGLKIPGESTIKSAYIQFTSDDIDNVNPCNLTVSGAAIDDPVTFLTTNSDLSSRTQTSEDVSWSPANWIIKHEAGPDEKTPDLANIVQEIVNRSGYSINSALMFFVEGTGRRSAESIDGGAGEEAILCIEYVPPQSLPVELITFSAKEKVNQEVLLEWVTASEENNKHFIIERTGDGGKDFIPIGTIHGNGTTSQLQRYQFTDKQALSTGYYRLRQVDFDESYTFSNTVVVKLKSAKEEKLIVYPSVAEDEVNIRFSSFATPKSLLKVVDRFGKIMYKEIVETSNELEFRKLNLSDYTSGLYYISLTDGDQFISAKFVVVKRD